MAESTLVAVVLITLFLAILQLGLALHIRNTLVACAAEGARYGANADRDPGDAAGHTAQLVRAALADSYASDVSAGTVEVEGLTAVQVTVRARLPVLGWLGPRSLTVRGHALEEDAV